LSNHASFTHDLTRLFGICDLEKLILTFPPHGILSLYISRVVSNFYGTEIRFGLVLGQLAVLKKMGLIMSNFDVDFFLCFQGQKN
jgi:hypothetical protein